MSDPAIRGVSQRNERKRRLLKGLMLVDAVEHEIVIRNLSSRGIGAVMSRPAPCAGTQVAVRLPAGTMVNGKICWARGKSFGVELTNEIAPEDQSIEPAAALPVPAWQVQSLHRVDTPRVDPASLRRV